VGRVVADLDGGSPVLVRSQLGGGVLGVIDDGRRTRPGVPAGVRAGRVVVGLGGEAGGRAGGAAQVLVLHEQLDEAEDADGQEGDDDQNEGRLDDAHALLTGETGPFHSPLVPPPAWAVMVSPMPKKPAKNRSGAGRSFVTVTSTLALD